MNSRILLPLMAMAFVLQKANADPAPPRQVSVSGTAIVWTAPDEMHWTVAIYINDSTLAKAKDRHDASLASALKYIKGMGDAVKDLQTGGIRFERLPYPESSLMRKNPFRCSTQFTFTLTDFNQYGALTDALSQLDGAQVESVEYASSKEAELSRDALKRALLDGQDKARDLAETAGCGIDKPLTIMEQEGYGVRPEMMNAMAGDNSTSGSPGAVAGRIQFSARVEVTYDLLPK